MLIGVFVFACLVLPGVFWLRHDQGVAATVRATAAWLDFFDPEYALLPFISAPPLDVQMGLLSDRPVAAVEGDPLEWLVQRGGQWAAAEGDQMLWLKNYGIPPQRLLDNGLLHYKVTPSFDFEKRELQLRGVTIKLWINF
jgi:hypothetical protein